MSKLFSSIKQILFSLLFSISLFTPIQAQDIFDTLQGDDADLGTVPGLATEKIVRISDSKRIFLITNNGDSFYKGDFISLIYDKKLTARALVAKTDEGISGIKILKIYSLNLWNSFRPGLEVQVLRGDDSYFQKLLDKDKSEDTQEDNSLIEDEDDLFDDTNISEDDLTIEEKKNRAIKTDNLIFAGFGYLSGQNVDGSSASYQHFNGSWAYQVSDNIWGEASYGRSLAADYPASGLDTVLNNITMRLKYTIEAPFYSYIQPYAGYQIISADSPGAGQDVSGSQKEEELALVSELEKSQVVFGITVLKRLVPGWFMRADLGNDIVSLGFGLEF